MDINKSCTQIESKFNFVGSIPLVGSVSGVVRAVAGQIQSIAGVIFAAFAFTVSFFDRTRIGLWEERMKMGLEHGVHGILNTLRGIGESALSFSLAGTLLLFGSQYFSKNKFAPLIQYGQVCNLIEKQNNIEIKLS